MILPKVAGMEKIEHVVILMMENRSFDHYLGALNFDADYKTRVAQYQADFPNTPVSFKGQVDGLPTPLPTNLDENDIPVPAWNLESRTECIYMGYPDLPHGPTYQERNHLDPATGQRMAWFIKNYEEVVREDMAAAKSDQASIDAAIARDGNVPMGFYTRDTLPVLYSLADNFTVCDRWFSSMLSSTWPNRKYLHSGVRDADKDTQSLPPFPGFLTTPIWNVIEDQRDQNGNKYTWKSYFTDLPFLAFWYKFAAFHAFHNFTSIDNFVADCQADRLPTISILDPAFGLCDDHPTHDVRLGQKFIGLVVDALTHSESWASTALIITYDENGGFFDHVEPPVPCDPSAVDTPLGFRVPTIVVSPYTPAGVCSTDFDHTSIMHSIIQWLQIDTDEFDPAVFGTRYLCANSIWSSCFDFNMTPREMDTYTNVPGGDAAFANLTWEQGIQQLMTTPQGDLEGLLERMFLLPGLKLLDQRSKVFDNLNSMESKIVDLKRML